MIVKLERPLAVPPPKEGPWRLPDHLDLPPAQLPRSDGAPPWCFPDHTMLPDKDGSFVKNAQEPPQSQLLTESIRPHLNRLRPDGDYLIGQDLGIFWKLLAPPDTLRGAIAPDWFYVPGIDPFWYGEIRRCYVLWQELVSPNLAIEYVSGNGSEERDQTPEKGKFWIYEQRIHADYYAVYEVQHARVEVYRLDKDDVAGGVCHYSVLAPNAHGRYSIPQMQAELGIWRGKYQDEELPWLRWWDHQGILLPTGQESAETERQRAETERQRADAERQRADKLAERLRALGVNPDEVS